MFLNKIRLFVAGNSIMKPKLRLFCVVICASFSTTDTSFAQQVTGELGSPNATTTIDGKQLPPPPPIGPDFE